MTRLIDMIGQKHGKLTVIKKSIRKGKSAYWVCECECGRRKEVRRDHLLSGDVETCGVKGCRKFYSVHGNAGIEETTEYRIWGTMKSRCLNPNDQAYENYGGRGITICEEWLSFENFLNDMGSRPSENHTLERINNDKGYSRENCKWATWETQNRGNKRLNKNNTSGVRGVYLNKKTGSWYASIYTSGKQIHLGTFNSFVEAATARKQAELKYWKKKSS